MENRTRDIHIHFCVTEEEKMLIRQRMYLSNTKNMGAFLRKMAIDGYIINTDLSVIKELIQEVNKIGVNINQIAHKANEINSIYKGDVEKLQKEMSELWHILRSIQSKLH